MKILFLTNIPSPYRVDFFNELGKYCDLTVLFEKAASKERNEAWKSRSFKNFKGIVLKGISTGVDQSFCVPILNYIKENFSFRIICNYYTPTGMLAITYFRTHKLPYWIEGDGGFPGNGQGFKEKVKRYFFKNAVGYFSTSKMFDLYCKTYGAEERRIVRYPFSCIYNHEVRKTLKKEKWEIKNTLPIKEEKVIISIGQYIHRKGFDILIQASQYLGENVGIYIIGGNPQQSYQSMKANLKHYGKKINFVDFQDRKSLHHFYCCADLFVLPTREDIWGLVINEAMAHGLPIITTKKCIAGLELIENGVNGYLLDNNNPKNLAKKINKILNENELMENMGMENLKKISGYTIETMVQRHLEIFGLKKEKEIRK